MACGEQRQAHQVWTHWRATVAQIAERVHAGYDRKVSEQRFTQTGQNVHADSLSTAECATMGTWESELDHGTIEEGGLVWCGCYFDTNHRPNQLPGLLTNRMPLALSTYT